MNELDAMRRLAEANPVEAHDLTTLDLPGRSAKRLPRRRLGLALAIATVAAALVSVFAFTGSDSHHRTRAEGRIFVFSQVPHGATGGTGPTGASGSGVGPRPGTSNAGSHDVFFRFNRSGGALSSVDVSVWVFPRRGFKLEVVYLGPPGDFSSAHPVYRTHVSADSLSPGTGGVGPSGAMGPGGHVSWDWSGTLSPRDWPGGCQGGDYEIDFDFGTTRDFRVDTSSDYFHCSGS